MTFKIKLTADAQTGAGVNLKTGLRAFLESFAPYSLPLFLPESDEDTMQILHIDTPVESDEAATPAVLLEGRDFLYTFSNHSVSGQLDSISFGSLGPAWDAAAEDLAVGSDGLVAAIAGSITLSELDVVNPVGEKGQVHEIVSSLMGGGPDGTEVDPAPILDLVYSQAHDLRGSAGDDVYKGTAFDDSARGNRGDDLLNGQKGADRLLGNGGSDTLLGAAGADQLWGGAGRDTLKGGGGADRLFGGGGRDTLEGGKGKDQLEGGGGADTLTGGKGADQFIFSKAKQADGDTITDFSAGQGDVIALADIDARSDRSGDQSFSWIGAEAFTGKAGQLRSWQEAGSTFVAGDTDGDGVADFTIGLSGLLDLTASDFLL